jgi:hypothetical protein
MHAYAQVNFFLPFPYFRTNIKKKVCNGSGSATQTTRCVWSWLVDQTLAFFTCCQMKQHFLRLVHEYLAESLLDLHLPHKNYCYSCFSSQQTTLSWRSVTNGTKIINVLRNQKHIRCSLGSAITLEQFGIVWVDRICLNIFSTYEWMNVS